MINRVKEIKKKGFSMNLAPDTQDVFSYQPTDFSKIKVGLKTLDDAILELGDYSRLDNRLGNKDTVMKAMYDCDYETMKEISNFFYKTSGIYSRLCRYMAYLYRYDWMVTPYINGFSSKSKNKDMTSITDAKTSSKDEKILQDFHKVLMFMESMEVKKLLGEIALKVIKNGCYYGYLIHNADRVNIQELPLEYCRARFEVNGRPAVEFNMKFFDEQFRNTEQRMKILNLFPSEFKKGYKLYKEGRLPAEYPGDTSGWYLLDVNSVIKFNLNGEDFPAFVSVIPAIIDLNNAQALDRKKMQQKLLFKKCLWIKMVN